MERYDIAVIGAGQAGEALAIEFARAGRRTALIDEGQLDGSSANSGAGSSKAPIASANLARMARRAADFGVETGTVVVDLGKVQQRRHAVIDGLRTPVEQALNDAPGLDVMTGQASFLDARTLQVTELAIGVRRVCADRTFINSGARPAMPDLPGLSEVPFLDSGSAMALDAMPSHLLVLGGSHAALELGQMFCRFGSRVSIIERQERLLPREDRDIAATVVQILREDGLEVFLETAATSVEADGKGGIRMQVRNPAGRRVLKASHLLVVSGRAPNTGMMNLAAAGVEVDGQGCIRVNERLETSVPGIYALGDVTGGPAFTHMAYDDLRIIRANLLENARATTAGRMCPYTISIDPQLARVGISETEARVQGRSVRVARLPMSRVARAVELNETRGFMKVVVDAESGRILGAAVLGIGGGEVMAMLQIAMMANMPYTALRDGVFAHPTLAESLNNLFMAMEK